MARPVSFEAAGPGRYAVRGAGHSLLVSPRRASVRLGRGDAAATVAMTLLGADGTARCEPRHRQPGRVRAYRGGSRQAEDVACFADVTVPAVYPGIDLVYYGQGPQVEYDFRVAPHANPEGVALRLSGAEPRLDWAGGLRMQTAAGTVALSRPVAYQEVDGRRQPVPAEYRLSGDEVRFALGPYDRSRELVIDPLLSVLIDGAGTDVGNSLAVDATGRMFVAGVTTSSSLPGATNAATGGADAYAACVAPDGTVEWLTYVGGSGDDSAAGLALDGAGGVYLVGETNSPSLPAATNSPLGARDAFVAHLTAGGSIDWATYLGGSADDRGCGIAAAPGGDVVVAGYTYSSVFGSPGSVDGATRAFAARLAPSGAPRWATILGGAGSSSFVGVAVDAAGRVYAAGEGHGNTIPGVPGAPAGGIDALVARFSPTGSLDWGCWLGGSQTDRCGRLVLNGAGHALIVGTTSSGNLPASTNHLTGEYDAFVGELSDTGSPLWTSYVGGDSGSSIGVDSAGRIYVAGDASSNLGWAVPPNGGETGPYVARLDRTGRLQSVFLFGEDARGSRIAGLDVDSLGQVYVTGETGATTLPGQVHGSGGRSSSYILRLDPAAPTALAITSAPATARADQDWSAEVEVRGPFGDRLPDNSTVVTLGAIGNGSYLDLHGTNPVVAQNGVAHFSSVFIREIGRLWRLRAMAPGLVTGYWPGYWGCLAGEPSPTHSTVSPNRTTALADGSDEIRLTVSCRDAYDNRRDSGDTVTLTADPAAGMSIEVDNDKSGFDGEAIAHVRSTRSGPVALTATINGTVTTTPPVTVTFLPGPADAHHSTVTVDKTEAIGDGADAVTFTFAIKDALGNPVPGVAPARLRLFDLGPTDSVVVGPSGPTDANGQATFVVRCPHAQSTSFHAYLDTQHVGQPIPVTFLPIPADPARSTFTADKTTARADGHDPITLTVVLRDAHGDPLVGVRPSLVTDSVEGLVPAIFPLTDASGTTSAPLACDRPKAVLLHITVDGVTLDQSLVVAFAAGPADAAQSTVVADKTEAPADGQEPVTFTVTVRDANGHAVPGVAPSRLGLTASGSDVTIHPPSAATNEHGQATATATSTRAQSASFAATLDGQPLGATMPVTFQPGPVDQAASALTAEPATAVADGQAAITVTLSLKDHCGNPVPGVAKTAITAAAGSTLQGDGLQLVPPAADSDASGRLTGALRATRPQTVTLTLGYGSLSWSVELTFTPRPVSAAKSTVTLAPAKVAADGDETATLTATLRDESGAPVEGSPVSARKLTTTGPSGGLEVVDLGADSAADGTCQVQVRASQPGTYPLVLQVGEVGLQSVDLRALRYVDLTVEAGRSFIGLPLAADPESFARLLATPGLAMAGWDAAAQVYRPLSPDAPPPPPGTGLWVQTAQPLQFRLQGEPQADEPVRIPLRRGWNAIADPFNRDLTWTLASLRVEAAGADRGVLADEALWERVVNPYGWLYEPGVGYQLVFDPSRSGFESALGGVPRMRGLWLQAEADDLTLVLPPPAAGSRARARRAVTARDWAVALCAGQGGASDRGHLIGVSSELHAALGLAEPPAADGPRLVTLSILGPADRALAGLLRPAGEPPAWEAAVTAGAPGDVVVTWPGLGRATPRGLILELADLASGQTVLMNTHSAWRFTAARAGETRRFRVTARTGRYARTEITALGLAGGRAGGGAVTLNLTGPATVTVTIRGLGGRLVRRLQAIAPAAGPLTVDWDGLDESGHRAPAGTYVLEATAQSENGALSRATRTVSLR